MIGHIINDRHVGHYSELLEHSINLKRFKNQKPHLPFLSDLICCPEIPGEFTSAEPNRIINQIITNLKFKGFLNSKKFRIIQEIKNSEFFLRTILIIQYINTSIHQYSSAALWLIKIKSKRVRRISEDDGLRASESHWIMKSATCTDSDR